MARIQEQLTDHVVVLGYGVSGSQSVGELIERGIDPRCIVVIDPSEDRLAEAERLGVNVMAGDATRDETLKSVRIAEAYTQSPGVVTWNNPGNARSRLTILATANASGGYGSGFTIANASSAAFALAV